MSPPARSTGERVKGNRNHRPVEEEVAIGREEGHAVALGDRAQQEIGVRPRQPLRAAGIEALGRALVVGWRQWLVGKRTEAVTEPLERAGVADSAQDLLPDGCVTVKPGGQRTGSVSLIKGTNRVGRVTGAGYGNRTRLAGLGSQSITTMLSPRTRGNQHTPEFT